jgi:hypothetical protein
MWLDSWQWQEAHHVKASKLVLRPTRHSIRWATVTVSMEVQRPGHEADCFRTVPSLRMSGALPLVPHMRPWPAQRQRYLYAYVSCLVTDSSEALLSTNATKHGEH